MKRRVKNSISSQVLLKKFKQVNPSTLICIWGFFVIQGITIAFKCFDYWPFQSILKFKLIEESKDSKRTFKLYYKLSPRFMLAKN